MLQKLTNNELFIQMIQEYIHNTLERYEFDVLNVKNDIILHGYDSHRLHSLIVVETRLDTFRAECRRIQNIVDIYLSDNK